MSLWDYAVSIYAHPEVAAACLALQDDHGQCAPLLLWRAWAIDRELDGNVLAQAVRAARSWDLAVVSPLRAVRRSLRAPHPPVADEARLAVRGAVQAAELSAERRLLETLEALTPARDARPTELETALAELTAALGAPAPEDLLARLAAAVRAATPQGRAPADSKP